MPKNDWMVILVLCFGVIGCATPPRPLHLTPIPRHSEIPSSCRVAYVFPGSPAEKASLRPKDEIISVNGISPQNALEVLNLIDKSPKQMELVIHRGKKKIPLNVELNDMRPRFGISCDLQDVQIVNLTQDKSRQYIMSQQGPYSVSAWATINQGITFVRVSVTNLSAKTIIVGPEIFSAADGNRIIMNVLSPDDVMYVLHGDVGLRVDQAQSEVAWANTAAANARANASYTTNSYGYSYGNYYHGHATTTPDPGSSFASSFYSGYAMGAAIRARRELESAQADAAFVSKESLVTQEVPPTYSAEGMIYFPMPRILPMTIIAEINGEKFEFVFSRVLEKH